MGAQVSRCLRCFRPAPKSSTKDPFSETVPLHTEDKSFVSQSSGIELELLDDHSSTTVLEALDRAYRAVVDIVNREDLDTLVETADVRVCGKISERGYYIRTVWETAVGKDKVMEFFRRAELKPTWDVNMESCRVISQGDYTVIYQLYKKVVAVSPRDMVLASKAYAHGQTLMEVSTSIDTPECPLRENVIRAKVHVGGFSAETTENGLTRVVLVTEIDFGGVIPKSVMLRMSAMNMPAFVKNLSQGLLKDSSI